MRYYVIAIDGEGNASLAESNADAADRLTAALIGKLIARTIYVVGLKDHVALTAALQGESVTEASPDDMVFSEAIGKPDGKVTYARLIALARQRITELETNRR